MGSPTTIVDGDLIQSDSFDRSCNGESLDGDALTYVSRFSPLLAPAASIARAPNLEHRLTLPTSDDFRSDGEDENKVSAITLAEFVRRRFIPEFVENKRSAGRAHFHEILKFILRSEKAAYAPWQTFERTNVKRKAINSWPYIDSLLLRDISEDTVRHITATALESGYSIQTATHIRNVIRAIYSHAIGACGYEGRNPAALVTLPAVVQKNAHTLTLAQLAEVMALMRFPERAIALFVLQTEMNLVEICGLQWRHVNLTGNGYSVDGDWIHARTIAVRNQWYRGEFRPVTGIRKRVVQVPELLCSNLRNLKCRKQFIGPQDFVLASQSGSPVYPGNIAKRRLKSIGQSCDMPWLSWQVLHRTQIRLRSEFGRRLHKEYEKVLPLQYW
jgi:integrase